MNGGEVGKATGAGCHRPGPYRPVSVIKPLYVIAVLIIQLIIMFTEFCRHCNSVVKSTG